MHALNRKRGFTLIELLIVVSILAILVIVALAMVRGNRDKAADAKVKSELNRLKIAFEDYYGDHNCYPPPEYFDDANDCGGQQLRPYLGSVPCNPNTNLPYAYITDSTGCTWFKLYGNLKSYDEDSLSSPLTLDSYSYNYGVSSSNTTLETQNAPLPEGHNYYYCSALNNCTSFNPNTHVCTPYYTDDPDCDGGVNKCSSVGSCYEF